ncbi:hypothetical protein PEC18_30160 [Paucibacter sp. O1-1]|nr:hypothetical protein [Paucibacter sp. O1-1]MDA3829985.1 hypothetical protein [Paucibacter sp. O1-1]
MEYGAATHRTATWTAFRRRPVDPLIIAIAPLFALRLFWYRHRDEVITVVAACAPGRPATVRPDAFTGPPKADSLGYDTLLMLEKFFGYYTIVSLEFVAHGWIQPCRRRIGRFHRRGRCVRPAFPRHGLRAAGTGAGRQYPDLHRPHTAAAGASGGDHAEVPSSFRTCSPAGC